jgi:hypothetical protein
MVEMIWKEPPPAVSSEKAPVLAELQKHPGRWAMVQPDRSSSGAAAPWQKLGCQAKASRKNPGETPAKYDVYARWPEGKTGSAKTAAAVANAVASGTALKPPAPQVPKAEPVQPVVSDPGLNKYLENRRARVK